MINSDSVSSEKLTIEAPAELVWSVIVDFEHYHLWNAFCPEVAGVAELGSALTMKVDLGNGLQEQVENGIEAFPGALEMLFNGGNTGKLIVKVGN